MTIETQNNSKVLGMSDIIIMTVTSNFGIRWLPIAAGLGIVSSFYWLLGALLFLLPLSIISAMLSRVCPEEGGIYAWTKEQLGDRAAFIVAWLYWVNNVFAYPGMLIFLAANLAYSVGMPALSHNHLYTSSVVIITLWFVIFINCYGINISRLFIKYGGILGSIIPVFVLIFFAMVLWLFYQHIATHFAWSALLPHQSVHIVHNLSTLTIIMFAMAGVEILPTFANSVKKPKTDLYFGLLIGATLLLVLYIIGTLAVNIIINPAQLSKTSGLMESFEVLGQYFGVAWLSPVIGFLLVIAELSAISILLLAPAIMFFKCTPKGVLPEKIKIMNRYGAPQNAMIFMGILVTVVVVLTNALPSVDDMYQVLILLGSILYFIPYLFLAIVFFKFRERLPLANFWVFLVSLSVLFSISLGIIFSFVPPDDLHTSVAIFNYEFELVFGSVLMVAFGYWLYSRRNVTEKQII